MPPLAPLLHRAAQLLKAGSAREAIAPLAEAARLRPADPAILHDLGLAYLEAGQPADAREALQRAIAARPRYADAWFRLGIALENMADWGGAIRAYDRATEIQPSLTEAWFRAGALVFTLGHREEAIGCFRRAASSGAKSAYGQLGAARALLAEERDGQAERVLRRMLALAPHNAMAQDLLGNVLADRGGFEEARLWFARAIAAAPLMAGSYYDLVRCRPLGEADAGLPALMRQALQTPGLENEQILRVHLALGKAADDFGEHGEAMAHFDAADEGRSRLAPFDSAGFDAQVDRMIAYFSPELIARAPLSGSEDATPLIIVGMPRSGTTLIEQIVSAHPDVAAGGELNFWNERGIAWHNAGAAVQGSEDFFRVAAAEYLAVLRRIGGALPRVTDKMPFNFLWAGLIHLALPRARIIHCRRSAIDTAISIHQTHFNPRLAFPTGGAALVAYFGAYRRLTGHWRRVLPAETFIEVEYEQLTRAPDPVIRGLIGRCGLDWDPGCLSPQSNARVVRTPSRWQARQPIYGHAVQRWRRYEPFLGPLGGLIDDAWVE